MGWTLTHGRRNWLFSDTVGGATASANLYSLVETCKANRVDISRWYQSTVSRSP